MAADQILFNGDVGGGAVQNAVYGFDPLNLAGAASSFFDRAGNDPISAMIWIFLHGGWIVFVILMLLGGRIVFLGLRQMAFDARRRYVLLAVDVPRASEQTVKAIDNMFAHLAGAHSSISFLEKWWEGKTQDLLTFEIISIEGHIQYLVRTIEKYHDLLEGSIYAQYPDAEITEVEDYTSMAQSHYPNETHECFGTELMPVKNDVYPLKTYEDFEHGLTQEFKDPLAVMVESFSRLGPGEQCWYQIVITPISQGEYVEKAKKEIMKLASREPPPAKENIVEKALKLPMTALSTAASILTGPTEPAKKEKDPFSAKMMLITPGERKIIEGVEEKMSKIQFLSKIRFVYIAKKEVFSKPKVAASFIGAIKQFNTNDMQALKPDFKRVGISSSLVFFKKQRNDQRKNRLIEAYRERSNWKGLKAFHLGTDELASLWHLPVLLNVKAPQVKKTETKKVEPPSNIPFA
jgi:hypothetical protein